ncbi:MAG TPA: MarR family transcriptional regulator [Galbitalea sp.]|nr:MarR family transcriptional regulator [Galbitalea sp.]
MSQEIDDFVERAGLVFEDEGMPRMAGRILGFLMVSEPRQQSIPGLIEALGASSGSVSTMTRYLERQGYIERVSIRGDRKDYFALRGDMPAEILNAASQSMRRLSALFERGAQLSDARHAELTDAQDLFAFLEGEYPTLIERWRAQRKPAG